MRKVIFNLLLLGAMAALFGSCKDDEKPVGGSFTYNGEKVTLKKGFYADWGSDQIGDDFYYYWTLTLTTQDLAFDEEEEEMTGEGDLIYLGLYGFNIGESELPVGTFEYDANEGENELDYALILLGYGGSQFEYTDDVKAGVVTISKSGDSYTITFTLTLETDEVVSGKYQGKLSYGYVPL